MTASSMPGPLQVARKKSDFRTGTSPLKNLRKVITPIQLATALMVHGIHSFSERLHRICNSSHVAHEGTELSDVVIKPSQVIYGEISANVGKPQCLASLPLDLLIEIIKYLDWRAVLEVRKVRSKPEISGNDTILIMHRLVGHFILPPRPK